jgi:hypothetical protein
MSGVQSFLALLLCLGITALIVPMALKLPAWVEAEIVLAAWWAIWCVALTLFLYSGWLVTHDFHLGPTLDYLGMPTLSDPGRSLLPGDAAKGSHDGGSWGAFTPFAGDTNPLDGCVALLVAILVLPFILLFLVFLVEAAVLLALLLYLLIRGMLAQVANSRLRCRGRPGRSFAFGVLWATLYTAPLAGFVWFVHRLQG